MEKKVIKQANWVVLLNIGGLSLSLLIVIYIALWINHELSYDKWIDDCDRVYRVETIINFTGDPFVWNTTPAPLVESLLKDYPEVEKGVRIMTIQNHTLQIREEQFTAKNIYFAPGSLFNIFPLEILKGYPISALDEPNSIVLSERVAQKYFGDDDPIGKQVLLDNNIGLIVKGVIKDTPINTHIIFDYLISFDVHLRDVKRPYYWGTFGYISYIKLLPDCDPEEFNTKIEGYLKTKKEDSKGQFFINPLNRLYLYKTPGFDSMVYDSKDRGPITRVIFFGIVGIFTLSIGVINFVNLSISIFSKRAKEIGVRKVYGATRFELVRRLFGESVLQTTLALLLSLFAAIMLLPLFNFISGIQFQRGDLLQLGPILIYTILAIFTGLVTGLYPAVVLSSFKPIKVLKNNPKNYSSGSGLRKVLVFVQFMITIMFMFSIVIINRQINYMQNVDLGFDADRVMVFYPKADYKTVKFMAEEVEKISVVDNVAIGNNVPVNMDNWATFSEWDGNIVGNELKFHLLQVDDNYLDLLGIEIVNGRKMFRGQSRAEVLINEVAVKEMGIIDPIGKRIFLNREQKYYEIVGVVKDFYFRKLTDDIKPIFIYKTDAWYLPKLIVKMGVGVDTRKIEEVTEVLNNVVPDHPVDYIWLDAEIDSAYKEELRLSNLINIATLISIIISSVGLFSIASFSVISKRKEIGVRKVYGANNGELLILLNKEYWIALLMASVIGFPTAYIIISNWLESYAYHINILPIHFFITLFSVLIIATLTISFHTYRSSNLNPVKTLRDE